MMEEKKVIIKNEIPILNRTVSFQTNSWSSISKELTIKEVLFEIQSGKYLNQISSLRNLLKNGKKEEYIYHKRTLPAITFCGTFNNERKRTQIRNYNSIIVLDVDKLEIDELRRVKKCFNEDSMVLSFWESPSKEGVKGLVELEYKFELNNENIERAHKIAFQNLANYFSEKYNIKIDSSGSDITRLCFTSFDPNLIIKNNFIPFEVNFNHIVNIKKENKYTKLDIVKNINESSKDLLFNPKERNKPGDRYLINSIIKYLNKKQLSITYSYEEWYKVGMAIANTFTYEIGEKYFLKLSLCDQEKYNELNCKKFLVGCYESRTGAINFSSIVYLAKNKGYIVKK